MTTESYLAKRDLPHIPSRLQTQRALNEQLRDLAEVANKLGLYDAADFCRAWIVGRIDAGGAGER